MGLQKEGVRVQAAKDRSGFTGMCRGVDQSHHAKHDEGLSRTSHDSQDWVTQLKHSLPGEISAPCKLSLGLTVDSSPETLAKLVYLLDYLESNQIAQWDFL